VQAERLCSATARSLQRSARQNQQAAETCSA